MLLPLLAVLTTMHYEADVRPGGGDYVEVEFVVPENTVEIQVSHSDGSDYDILDWGVWSPEGFRGWGGGLTDDAVIGVAQSSRGYLAGAITPGTWRVVIGKAKLDDMGHYSIDVTCRDDATLTVQPTAAFDPAPLKTGARWYKGDFHVHSEQSGDASATFQQIAALAKQQGLDFVNLSDHNTTAQLPLVAAFQQSEREVLFLRGAEITTYAGHGNSVGTSRYVDHRIGFQNRTVGGILDDVAAQDAVFIVNHPALELGDNCIGCAWGHADTDWSKVSGIEVLTGKWDVTEPLFTPGAIALWDAQEDAGHRLAAIGGSDDHRAGTGTGFSDTPLGNPTTLVYADELSERAIIDGIEARRTIVNLRGPNDPLVEVTVRDQTIGADVTVLDLDLKIRVVGGAGMFAQVWRDGENFAQLDVDSDDFTGSVSDGTLGQHRYRVELIDEGGQRVVVTSHIYVSITQTGFGCCNTSSRASLLPALFVVICIRRRRCRASAAGA